MLNVISLMGRIAAEPELKTFEGEKGDFSVGKYRLAVSRDYKDRRTGDYTVDFFQVKVTNKAAEYAKKNLKKGMWVIVTGHLYLEPYEKDGVKRIAPVVYAKSHYPIFSKKEDTDGMSAEDQAMADQMMAEQAMNDGFSPMGDDQDPFELLRGQ